MSHRIVASTARAAFGCRRALPSSVSPLSSAIGATSSLSSSPSSSLSPSVASRRPSSRGYHYRSNCSFSPPSNYYHLSPPRSCRAVSSSPRPHDSSSAATAEPKSEQQDAGGDEDSDPCPPWQNPLHHNNPDVDDRVLSEEFAPGEEMPTVPLPPFETPETEGKVLAPPHIHALADEIVRLSMLEVKELVDRVGDHFGFDDEDSYAADDGGEGEGAAAEEVVEEKTAFDLKLTGFEAKSKIKVIKEVRSMAGLGLKEAKELVEGAPTVVKKDIKMEEAEELKAKLEAVGATIEIV